MTLMIQTLANYLGKPASAMLADLPFKNWTFEKSFDDDLAEPINNYVFPNNGLDFLCNGSEKIITIFLYSSEDRSFDGDLLDLPLSSSRQQVIERLGSPSKSRSGMNDPILGEYGPWDAFAGLGYTIHVEYRADADRIKMITLMHPDAAP